MKSTQAFAGPSSRACLLEHLLAADRAEVMTLADRLSRSHRRQDLLPSETGLALLSWRDAVLRQVFYLGEVPMARVGLALIDAEGRRAEGAAVAMTHDLPWVEALAVLDAVASAQWPGTEAIKALAERGAAAIAEREQQRRLGLQRTRVDFSLLAEAQAQPDTKDET